MRTLAQQAQRGVLWNTSFSMFRDVLQFGVTLILVRYLSPDVYGQYGLVNGIIGFLYVFPFVALLPIPCRFEEQKMSTIRIILPRGA